jgi:hypothetical protein
VEAWLPFNSTPYTGRQVGYSGIPSTWTSVDTGDFDGDGRRDLLWTDSGSGANGPLVYWKMSTTTLPWGQLVVNDAEVIAYTYTLPTAFTDVHTVTIPP